MMKLACFVLVLPISLAFSFSIPSFVHLCKRSDPQLSNCFKNSLLELIQYSKKGIAEMNLQPFDPITFENIHIHPNTKSGEMDIRMKKGTLEYVSEFDLSHVEINLDEPRWTMKIVYPFIKLLVDYSVKGKLLLFELNTSGMAHYNLTNAEALINFYGSYFTKNDKKYIKFDNCVSEGAIKGIVAYLENIIPNNKLISDTVNAAINDNIETLFQEFKPIVLQTYCESVVKYINPVFDAISIDDLFPN